ncbi:S8 family serine peptidase [Tepidibacter formicigenes]|jgi:subtilisin family serine protease|uniref:Subtilase family protein n=1 Tax=Tepidibacter formicigenes DSM 15518 TaxID=1123349 RepID=A0A1M6THJ4_9FIRM|nr:S8 family serine peptidase [Tepidibacter formicigenes]SHK56248.1 Subtilase family protein [Tepidibacter formicigenes DSM 15518]
MKEKVKVAVIDTGIDKNHKYLKDNIIGGIAFESKDDYILVSNNYEDENGHGTLCTSIIKKEFENVEFFVVKALNNLGRTNIQVLEEALKYLLNIDIKILNLSLSVMESELVQELYEICEELNIQDKIIVCSVANGFECSYPAKFNNVIGVKGFILENENAFWYNKDYDIQCVIDNNSYLRCDLNNSYKLFGKCNSQAAAKLTGVIASILYENPSAKLVDLNVELEKFAIRNYWTNKDLEKSKRYPKLKSYENNINQDILKDVVDVIREVLSIDKDNEELYKCSLFNHYIGLNEDNCFEVIKKLEEKFELSLDYMNISRYDFASIYTLTEFVENNLNNGGRIV